MKTANIVLDYQPTISRPPQALKTMFNQACSSDGATIQAWREQWLANIRANKIKYGSFADHAAGSLHGSAEGLPCIIAGSGPSLKLNIEQLKNRPKFMKLLSCLHNFHAMEDNDCNVDYYFSLDAGEITVGEVSEGGKRTEEEYWELTTDKTLICVICTHPKLLEKWRGKVLFFNVPVPNKGYMDEVMAIEPFHQWFSTGGNVLGAATYFAKGYLGCPACIFVGTDFAFSNRDQIKFHYWDSKYDASIGETIRAVDIYGNSIKTWGSYYNFKQWFDYLTNVMPGIWINSTEGGIFGAYREGNIQSILYLDLQDAYRMFTIHDNIKYQAENPSVEGPGSHVILI
jgi:hypothetical protein